MFEVPRYFKIVIIYEERKYLHSGAYKLISFKLGIPIYNKYTQGSTKGYVQQNLQKIASKFIFAITSYNPEFRYEADIAAIRVLFEAITACSI